MNGTAGLHINLVRHKYSLYSIASCIAFLPSTVYVDDEENYTWSVCCCVVVLLL